jgi:DNA-binding FadR family transcriptional regulator
MADKMLRLKPLKPIRNLTGEVVERIATEIRSGRLGPGTRLPTEQKLMSALKVSRTVVREAVSALRAEGLVITRQGSGAFVADKSGLPFRINPDGLSSIEDVLNVMELRLAIEVEAAALAAERATAEAVAHIERALAAIEAAIESNDGAVTEDFAFHRAIAVATGNPQFALFLEFLGRHVIPRQSVRAALTSAPELRSYLIGIQKEHAKIFAAIRDRDPAEARKAMRKHLTLSLARYRGMASRQAG